MQFEIFDPFIDSVIVLDEDNSLLYANNSAKNTFCIRNVDIRKQRRFDSFVNGGEPLVSHISECSAKWKESEILIEKRDNTRRYRVLVQDVGSDKKKKVVLFNDSTIEANLQKTFFKEKGLKEQTLEELSKYKSGLEFFAFAILFSVTGFSFLALKYTVVAFPPFLINGVRFTLAGVFFLSYLVHKKHMKLSWSDFKSEWGHAFVFRIIGYGGLAYAMVFIPSGLAAVIMGTVPLLLAAIEALNGRIKLTRNLSMGIALGFISSMFIAWNSLSAVTNWIGLAVISVVVISWAVGAVSLGRKRNLFHLSYNYLFSGLVLLGVSYVVEDWNSIDLQNVQSASVLGFIYLFVFMTMISDPAMTWLMGQVSATKASMFIYVKPVVAVLVGALVAHEPFSVGIFVSVVLMFYALRLVLSEKQGQSNRSKIDSVQDVKPKKVA